MKVIEVSTSTSPQTVATSTTNYATMGGCGLGWAGSEAGRQQKRNTAGTLSNLYIRISANSITATTTYRVRKNTANGNQTVSVGSGATGEFQDVSNTDAITTGDLVAVSVVTGGTGTNITSTAAGWQFSATSDTAQCIGFNTSGAPAVSTTQRFMVLIGGTDGTLATTEAHAQYKFKSTGTLKALSLLVSANTTSTAATTAVSRINTANGNQTVSVGAGLTGQFQDLTNTDAISSGTLACAGISVAAGGTGTCTYNLSYCEFATTNSSFVMAASGISGLTQGLSVTGYYPWIGFCLAPGFTTESSAQIKAQNSYKVQDLALFLRANSVSATSTLNLRKNAGNANQTISITSNTSGYFEDVSHTDTVVATDEINYQLVTGGTGTSMQIASMATLVSIAGRLFSVCLLNGIGTGGPFLSNSVG